MEQDKLQAQIDAFVIRCIAWKYNKEQIIGFAMLNYNIFYDEAKKRIESAFSQIKEE